jgi:hypothetical protein
MQKDKLRTKSIKLPSVEDRAIRLFNLCDWGQDQYIEDNTGGTFDDVMKLIKDRVVTSLRTKVFKDNSTTKIQEKQTKLLMEDRAAFANVKETLRGTVKSKGKKGKTEKLIERGTEIPASARAGAGAPATEGKEEGDEDRTETAAPTTEKPAAELTEDEIKKLWFNILQTFVNTLVVKSAASWSESMNLSALLSKYKIDKETLGREPSCKCSSNSNCKQIHDNLYEVVYCELKSFVPKENPGKINEILRLIDAAFETPLVEWNIYIESFLDELRSKKGGRRITRRKKTARLSKGNGVRKTLQQRSRNY